MIKIPYGISNFETLIKRGQYYVDRTEYIKRLESYFSSYLFFVRPRRFGKSLFLSVLEYYYGIEYQEKFERLFGPYYIGQHPTPNANQYLILKFDFSQIDTSSFENTFKSFLTNIKISAATFLGKYADYFSKADLQQIDETAYPSEVIQLVLSIITQEAADKKVYLLIDEYDHFANEILSFRFDEFNEMVGKNGFVRKFYEAIKVGTQSGIIDRLFVTGVSPITLDSLTSGFNIATNISLEEDFSAMLGFRHEEVREILRGVEVPPDQEEEVLELMRSWYNGYRFGEDSTEYIYNSDMVLYFAAGYSHKKQYPKELLDPNIASDYTKVRRLFKIKDKESVHLQYLDELLQTGQIRAKLIRQFELERRFDRNDFVSLLYYTGIVTIDHAVGDLASFKMPNYVIRQLYYQYFHRLLLERSLLVDEEARLLDKIASLAFDNEPKPLLTYIQSLLQELSLRDKRQFDEKYIKIVFISAFYNSKIYNIHSEYEVQKSPTEKGYIDIYLQQRASFHGTYPFVFELKYLKKEDAAKAPKIKSEAVDQLQAYLQHDPTLQGLENLKAYVVIFVGNEGEFVAV